MTGIGGSPRLIESLPFSDQLHLLPQRCLHGRRTSFGQIHGWLCELILVDMD
jgi:hypothetical protein